MMSKKRKSDRKSRFVVRPEEMKFRTREESDAITQKRNAEIEAHRKKMLEEAAEERAKQQSADDTVQAENDISESEDKE
jgi:hypothetical protein